MRAAPATSQIAQTTLRSVLGGADLDQLLAGRERLNEELQKIIDEQTEPWGIKVSAVEIKDAHRDDPILHAKLGLLVLIGVLVALHVVTPCTRTVSVSVLAASLVIVWLGIRLTHG